MIATIVDTSALWQTVVAAFLAGVGTTLVFSLAILGMARSRRRTARPRGSRRVLRRARAARPARHCGGDRVRGHRDDDELAVAASAFALVRVARNIAIIALLALIVAVVPGGGNAARAILATISLVFFALIGFAGYQLYRQNRLTYLGLDDGRGRCCSARWGRSC